MHTINKTKMDFASFDPENIRIGQPTTKNGVTTMEISYCTTPLPAGVEGPVKEEPLLFRMPTFDFPKNK